MFLGWWWKTRRELYEEIAGQRDRIACQCDRIAEMASELHRTQANAAELTRRVTRALIVLKQPYHYAKVKPAIAILEGNENV